MARTKADFEGLKVQEFLTKAQAMAYTLRKTPESFDEEIAPYVNLYEAGKGGCYYVPELRKRMLSLLVVKSKMQLTHTNIQACTVRENRKALN